MKQKVVNYLKETQAEIRQVTWPSKNELIGSTIVVIFVTIILAAFIYIVDKVLETIIFSLMGL
jgi:preprotein translocase subunit SecE